MCKVCAVGAIATDTHLDQGFYSGVLTFGANQKNNLLDETDVSGYRVWFADASLNKLGSDYVSSVTLSNKIATADCGCSSTQYSVTMAGVTIPTGATGFMVVAVDTLNFEMPVGVYVGGLADIWTTTTTTTTTSSTTTSHTTTTTTRSTTTTTTSFTIAPIASGAPASAALAWAVFVFVAAFL